MTIAPSTRLGPYEVVAPLGAGGMGEVYRARDPRLGREIAVKVLPEDLAGEPDRLRRFETEAKAAGALNHPNVLAIHDIGTHEGRPYVVYELLQGETLGGRMRAGRLSPFEALTWAAQVARGLAAAHARGIVHRDLKPENLFLTKDGPLKILDFGLAKVARPEPEDGASFDPEDLTRARESLTAEGAILGTAGYMSPEQVKGERADHRSDVFSLGVVLYEMLSGRRPFQGATVAETLAAILKDDPPALPDEEISPPIAEVVGRCLAKDPQARFQSTHDLAFALEVLAVSVAEPRPAVTGIGPPVATGRGLRRLGTLAAGLVGVAGLAALLWFLLAPGGTLRMVGPRQVTSSGDAGFYLATDGTWLYYSTFDGRLFQLSVAGGPRRGIDPWPDERRWTFAGSLSPTDPTQLTVGSRTEPPSANYFETYPLWALSLPAATPRRLGEIEAGRRQVWSPDGQQIAFSKWNEVFVVGKDGDSPRKILTVDEDRVVLVLAWSPDARIVHSVYEFESGGRLEPWVMRADGTERQRLLPDWPDSYFWDAEWTPDGRDLLFTSGDEAGGRFWSLEEGRAEPVPLTTGPLSCYFFDLDPNGLTAYASCVKRQSELFVYRREIGEWAPYEFLPEPAGARQLAYSRDGQWVAWTRSSEGTLWRSRLDGTQKLRLTEPGDLRASFKAWSPDGEWIVFAMGTRQGFPQELWVVSKDGQGLRTLAGKGSTGNKADWAPDGRVVLSFGGADDKSLELVDLKTGEAEDMPGTSRLSGVASSPDGRYLAAHDRSEGDKPQIRLLDWETGQWRPLDGVLGGMLQWSADSRHLYFGCGGDETRRICRVRVDSGEIETAADKMHPETPWHVDPQGHVVGQRAIDSWDIYAWDLERP